MTKRITIELPDIPGYRDLSYEIPGARPFRAPDAPGTILNTDKNQVHSSGPRFVVEKTRWRAEIGKHYFVVDEILDVHKRTEQNTKTDDEFWRNHNYFKHQYIAEEAAEEMLTIFKRKGRHND